MKRSEEVIWKGSKGAILRVVECGLRKHLSCRFLLKLILNDLELINENFRIDLHTRCM